MYARACAATGGATAIAAITLMTGALRREIVRWLDSLEHVTRKLLLAEAARFARDEARPLVRRSMRLQAIAATCAPTGLRSNFDREAPETWLVRFSLAPPRDPRAIPDRRAPRIRALWGDAPAACLERPAPPAAHSREKALHLARRFEAVRRVLEDPTPVARRLARLLARAVRRFPEIVKHYAMAPARTNACDPLDPRLCIDAFVPAFCAERYFHDSS